MEDQHGNKVCELLESELDEMPFFEDWTFSLDEIHNGWEYYSVQIRNTEFSYLIRANEDSIEVDLSEDAWQEVKTYNWTIKYFWMAILDADHLV